MAWIGSPEPFLPILLLLRKCCSRRHIFHQHSLLLFQLFVRLIGWISPIYSMLSISRGKPYKKCRTRSSLELVFGSVNFGLILIFPLSCHWHLLIHLGASSAHSSKDLEPWRLGWPKNQNLSVASYVNELCCFTFVLNFSFVPDLPSVLPPPEI